MKKQAPASGKPIAHAAFLRGINVGGNKIVSMEKLRKCFEAMGFSEVRTLLASGNVVFRAPGQDTAKLEQRIEAGLRAEFGFDISVILRTAAEMEKMLKREPFRDLDPKEDVKLYVWLFREKAKLKRLAGWKSPEKDVRVVAVTDREIFNICWRQASGRYGGDGMEALGKELGPQLLTTRNWNTMLKIAAAME